MKRIGLITTTVILFTLSLFVAYMQGLEYVAAPSQLLVSSTMGNYLNFFTGVVTALTNIFGGSLVAGIMVLALLVELVTLFPAVSVQLKQKKIHMFHKKLVERFATGELSMSHTNHERDVLYSVNERIHKKGAWLIGFQLLAFVLVLWGLALASQAPGSLEGSFSQFNLALLSRPYGVGLPVLAGLAYLLHSLVKIHLKQREDFIDERQAYIALGFSTVGASLVFYFASVFPVLLSVYFMTQITFATMRYIVVEENAAAWGKRAQRELIHMLRTSELHKNKVEHWSRKFNHTPIIRHLNFHLLEEALSMSLALLIVINGVALM